MQSSGNTLLVTGGGSGIGRAIAEAFHALGNQVIVAGRRQEFLDQTTAANPGMNSIAFDIESTGSIDTLARQVRKDYPNLNAVFHNAGIMRMESLLKGETQNVEPTIYTNLLGPIRLTAALLPQLLAQPQATILTNTSVLAFVPLALAPTYCATKAAIHAYTQALRYQLKDTRIQVIEVVPPYVQTELLGPQQAHDPRAVPLNDYIAETMHLLRTQPEATEILVESAKGFRFAEASGKYDEIFRGYNSTFPG